jgi:hypothetical protein
LLTKIETPNYIKKAFFPTLMQGRSGKFYPDKTLVVVYLMPRDTKTKGKESEDLSEYLGKFKKTEEGQTLYPMYDSDDNASYVIKDITVVNEDEVKNEVKDDAIEDDIRDVDAAGMKSGSSWLAIFGVIICIASVGVGIYYGMNFLANRQHRNYRQPPQHQDPINLSDSVHNRNEMQPIDDNDTAGIIDNEELDNPL